MYLVLIKNSVKEYEITQTKLNYGTVLMGCALVIFILKASRKYKNTADFTK